MSHYFPPYRSSGRNIKVELDLSSYATKTDLKNVTHVDVSSFASKTNLASLKTEVDKINVGELKTVPVDLAKLSNIVKNDVVKKTKYDKLVTRVDNIDTTGFALKAKYENGVADLKKKISDVDKKIPEVSNLVKKADLNAKITEEEGKIPSISGLATISALNAVENKIPDVSGLVKKTDFNTKVTEIEGKIPSISSLATNSALTAVEDKIPDVSSLVRKTNLDTELREISYRVTSNKSRHFQIENNLKKLEKFYSSYFKCKSHFEEDGTKNYLVFQGVYTYLEDADVSKTLIKFHANSWTSKGLSNEKISSVTIFEHPFIEYTNARIKLKFDESISRQELLPYIGSIADYCIVYRLSPRTNSSSIVLENCLFGKIKMIKNADTDKYKYQGHVIGFDSTGTFTRPDGGAGKMLLVLGLI